MIPLKFYRDDNYVYYNNPNGITKKMSIADFESIMNRESELPEYSSASQGKVLSVDSDGDLEWASLPPDELPAYSSSNQGEVLSVDSDGDLDWVSLPPSDIPSYQSTDSGKVLTVNSGGTGLEWGEGGGGAALTVKKCYAESSQVTINSSSDHTFVFTVYDVDTNEQINSFSGTILGCAVTAVDFTNLVIEGLDVYQFGVNSPTGMPVLNVKNNTGAAVTVGLAVIEYIVILIEGGNS